MAYSPNILRAVTSRAPEVCSRMKSTRVCLVAIPGFYRLASEIAAPDFRCPLTGTWFAGSTFSSGWKRRAERRARPAPRARKLQRLVYRVIRIDPGAPALTSDFGDPQQSGIEIGSLGLGRRQV